MKLNTTIEAVRAHAEKMRVINEKLNAREQNLFETYEKAKQEVRGYAEADTYLKAIENSYYADLTAIREASAREVAEATDTYNRAVKA